MKKSFYSLAEIAESYSISVDTLKRRIKIISNQLTMIGICQDGKGVYDESPIRLYSPKQVKLIVELLGEPKNELLGDVKIDLDKK